MKGNIRLFHCEWNEFKVDVEIGTYFIAIICFFANIPGDINIGEYAILEQAERLRSRERRSDSSYA